MTRDTPRSLESRVDSLEGDDEGEELTTVEAWRMFIEGNYDPADPPEELKPWIETART